MVNTIHQSSPSAGPRGHLSAQTLMGKPSPIARQQAIENALSMALYHVRNGDTTHAIRTATAKAIRAASMLKQACTDSAIGVRA